jgi:hypothetical protein
MSDRRRVATLDVVVSRSCPCGGDEAAHLEFEQDEGSVAVKRDGVVLLVVPTGSLSLTADGLSSSELVRLLSRTVG